MNDPWVVLGEIVKTHGLRGEVKVRSEIENPENFLLAGLFLRSPEGSLNEIQVLTWRFQKNAYLLKIAGLESVGQAQKLIGSELVCRGSRLPPPAEDEFYHFQLIGLDVLDSQDQPLGRLAEIMQTGAHDVYVVKSANNGAVNSSDELLLPGVSDYILAIDFERGCIVVDPSGGKGKPVESEITADDC
ncbi:MAG TPA: 16S rRNA processing protein RimM [Proteobacteria bacterium]|nr:16S rRNA processing protein RimM [Pseudomonadota bacterium]